MTDHAAHRVQILDHLRNGNTLTHDCARDRFGCARLAARICELRKSGWSIKTDMIPVNGVRVARYKLNG